MPTKQRKVVNHAGNERRPRDKRLPSVWQTWRPVTTQRKPRDESSMLNLRTVIKGSAAQQIAQACGVHQVMVFCEFLISLMLCCCRSSFCFLGNMPSSLRWSSFARSVPRVSGGTVGGSPPPLRDAAFTLYCLLYVGPSCKLVMGCVPCGMIGSFWVGHGWGLEFRVSFSESVVPQR
jgi:hypothetical protein